MFGPPLCAILFVNAIYLSYTKVKRHGYLRTNMEQIQSFTPHLLALTQTLGKIAPSIFIEGIPDKDKGESFDLAFRRLEVAFDLVAKFDNMSYVCDTVFDSEDLALAKYHVEAIHSAISLGLAVKSLDQGIILENLTPSIIIFRCLQQRCVPVSRLVDYLLLVTRSVREKKTLNRLKNYDPQQDFLVFVEDVFASPSNEIERGIISGVKAIKNGFDEPEEWIGLVNIEDWI